MSREQLSGVADYEHLSRIGLPELEKKIREFNLAYALLDEEFTDEDSVSHTAKEQELVLLFLDFLLEEASRFRRVLIDSAGSYCFVARGGECLWIMKDNQGNFSVQPLASE